MVKRYILIALTHFLLSVAFLVIADYIGVFKHFLELDFKMFHFPIHENALENSLKARLSRQLDVAPVNSYNRSFIFNPVHKCEGSSVTPILLILVKSAVNHFGRRAAVRRTWGSESLYPKIVKTVFLLGLSDNKNLDKLVKSEYEEFKDIVATNFLDSYYNNTIKTSMGLQWAVENCEHVPYYLFVDDDYFVSIKNLFSYLSNFLQNWSENFSNSGCEPNIFLNTINIGNKSIGLGLEKSSNCIKLFAGYVIHSSPHRHKFSKWYIDLKEYPFEMWPPYVTAGAYILSREYLTELFFMSMFTKMFKYDDIYLGILAFKANIALTHNSEFHFDKAKYSEPSDYKYVIASHGYDNPEELLKTWSECHSAGYT